MDDITRFLLSSSAQPSLTASKLQEMGKQASDMYLRGGTPLNEAVVKVASVCRGITAEQVMRVVEHANNSTFLDIFEKQAEDRNVHFDICDPRVVLRSMNLAADMTKQASADQDYSMSPGDLGIEKTASAIERRASIKDLEADLLLADQFGVRLSTPAMDKTAGADDTYHCPPCGWRGKGSELKNGKCPKCGASVELVKKAAAPMDSEGKTPTEQDKAKIREWIAKHDKAKDEDFHSFAEGLGLDVHKAEAAVYEMANELAKAKTAENTDIIPGGKAKGMSVSEFPKDQIQKGIKVEKEHTPSAAKAQEIAKDHLEEFPDYYTRLDKMEEQAKKELKKEAMKVVKIGGRHSDMVRQDLEAATSLESIKQAAAGGYRESNPFGELVRTGQRLDKMAEDAGLALLKNDMLKKEAEGAFVHELKQHMLEGGNLGEVIHALGSVGTPGQVKEAMSFAIPELVKHGLDTTKARAAIAAYEMTKSASARTPNFNSPLIQSFSAMIKSGSVHLQLAESVKRLGAERTKVAKMMARVSNAAQV